MLRTQLALMLACVMSGVSTDAFAQFDLPHPGVFARAEDQQRARLLGTPCVRADEGHGCYRDGSRLVREIPCTYHIGSRGLGSLPTDQCYKMEAPRRYRGIWIDEFEGQQFIAEGTKAPEWPRGDAKAPDWRKKADRAIAATIWLNSERANLSHKWQQGGRRVFVEFIGRKTKYPGNYGHMGMSGQEIIVDRIITQHECPKKGWCS